MWPCIANESLTCGMTAQLPHVAMPMLHLNELILREVDGHRRAPLGPPSSIELAEGWQVTRNVDSIGVH